METKELLKKVRKIEIKSKGLSNHIFAGEYHTAFKGRGMSFSEVREYQYGDDIRSIDWNVTARFNHPYIKIFEEERELTVMLLIDVSKSAFFGTINQFKSEVITEISAVLSFSAIKNNDKVGVIFFSDVIERFIPPKKGRGHILRIIRELIDMQDSSRVTDPKVRKADPEIKEVESDIAFLQESIQGREAPPQIKDKIKELQQKRAALLKACKQPGTGTDIGMVLRYLNNVMKKRAIVFLLSDFIDKNFQDALTIARKKHDITGMHIYDVKETELPDVGLIRVTDAETGGAVWLDTSSKKVRETYSKQYSDNYAQSKAAFRKAGADLVSIRTDESYVNALIKFFKKRM